MLLISDFHLLLSIHYRHHSTLSLITSQNHRLISFFMNNEISVKCHKKHDTFHNVWISKYHSHNLIKCYYFTLIIVIITAQLSCHYDITIFHISSLNFQTQINSISTFKIYASTDGATNFHHTCNFSILINIM